MIWVGSFLSAYNKKYTKINFNISQLCPYKCSYCMAGHAFLDNLTLMPTKDQLLNALENLKNNFSDSFLSIHVTGGGEPTFMPDFPMFISTLLDMPFVYEVFLITNLYRPIDWYSFLIDHPNCHKLSIVSTLHESQYDNVDMFINKALYLNANKLSLDVQIIMTNDNYDRVASIIKYVSETYGINIACRLDFTKPVNEDTQKCFDSLTSIIATKHFLNHRQIELPYDPIFPNIDLKKMTYRRMTYRFLKIVDDDVKILVSNDIVPVYESLSDHKTKICDIGYRFFIATEDGRFLKGPPTLDHFCPYDNSNMGNIFQPCLDVKSIHPVVCSKDCKIDCAKFAAKTFI